MKRIVFTRRLVLAVLAGALSCFAQPASAAESPQDARPGPGPVVNFAADGVVGCLTPPFTIDGTHTKEELIQAYERTVDHYAEAGVPYLFFNVCYMRAACPSEVWDTYWDVDAPDANTAGWPRAFWLVHKKGVDPFAVSVARARERGVSPWLSMRMNDFRRKRPGPDGRLVKYNEQQDLLLAAGRLETSLQGPRRHVVTFHDPAGPDMPNPRQLPAALSRDEAARVEVVTGPKPTGGDVIVRAGLDDLPGVAEAELTTRLNGRPCKPIDDLARPAEHKSYTHDPHRVFHVACAARRMLQFRAPVEAMRRGRNQVELRLATGGEQRVIWLEICIKP